MSREASLVLKSFSGSETTCAAYTVDGSEKNIFYVLCKITLSRMGFIL